ncbi:MAG: hypothetical protein K8I29_13985 [Alphaproteobacteria bacterium]|uniref:Uncharacterized protein n=1 Tax=Candidatus Nitrobium versatile TaxID=2884831 RepID=A0A953M1V3_9BACT|nr:hypothetical protein [Candidatus Nitrobium versatile]
MIVYRKQEQTITPVQCIRRIRIMLEELEKGAAAEHERVVEVLIEWGEFESALTDALCPERDGESRLSRALRHAGLFAGHMFCLSWKGMTPALLQWAGRLYGALAGLSSFALPETITLREPEGYAHYGLYPETYLAAARTLFREMHPERVACIGLRSIGTGLSSIVSAALEEKGCVVFPYTIRPRGHPFHRRIMLSPEFGEHLRSLPCSLYLVVDEGPGMSGTSLCCAAEKLSELGIADERIVLLPSWEPDGSGFFSEASRTRWGKHRKFSDSFENLWIGTGRLARSLPSPQLLDIAAGKWRPLFYRSEALSPAVHPHHEKRKFLCLDGPPRAEEGGDGPVLPVTRAQSTGNIPLLLRFAGLGRYGRAKHTRALTLAEAGFCQSVRGFTNGFLITDFIPGTPVTQGETDQSLLDTMAHYLSFLRNTFPTERNMLFDDVYTMVKRNTLLGLGREWVEKLDAFERFRPVVDDCVTVAVDGRMLPHEWLRTPDGYRKADAVDHHADQFFPCSQDIAWDIAGSSVEFGFASLEEEYLLCRYQSLSGDRGIRGRLPFYRVSYLAYRLGYATFAAKELAASPDGVKFASLVLYYAARLKEEILRGVQGIEELIK